jgi:hypothetical protein
MIIKQNFPVASVGYRIHDLIDTVLLGPIQHDCNIDINVNDSLQRSFLFFSDSSSVFILIQYTPLPFFTIAFPYLK